MIRRFSGPKRLLLLVACALGGGCEPLGHQVRPKTDESISEPAEASSSEGARAGVTSDNSKYFKPGRLSGALSDEGRDIERNLGVR